MPEVGGRLVASLSQTTWQPRHPVECMFFFIKKRSNLGHIFSFCGSLANWASEFMICVVRQDFHLSCARGQVVFLALHYLFKKGKIVSIPLFTVKIWQIYSSRVYNYLVSCKWPKLISSSALRCDMQLEKCIQMCIEMKE